MNPGPTQFFPHMKLIYWLHCSDVIWLLLLLAHPHLIIFKNQCLVILLGI